MGGTLFACGPDYDPKTHNFDDESMYVAYRYSGFMDLKAILIRATIAFLTALSSKQISKELLVKEGVADPEAVEGVDEAVLIVNYRSRIDKAIALVQGWLQTPGPPPETHPLANLFASLGRKRPDHTRGDTTHPLAPLLGFPPTQALGPDIISMLNNVADEHEDAFTLHKEVTEIMAEFPIDGNAIAKGSPHVLAELNLSGI
ncbi:hypothetical protein FB45DRAFT_922548 [Roridomyces roridus]|uniref:Uncharacterized protein n=1 Tax=Roridomyces roridus TaxID=1738132 RepID=A0AAD7BN66_9AGAR|nr:hypothetical protein FB45DRAFT_922548 [Roridomyces roridus]